MYSTTEIKTYKPALMYLIKLSIKYFESVTYLPCYTFVFVTLKIHNGISA